MPLGLRLWGAFEVLLRLARKQVPICEISNWGFTMRIRIICCQLLAGCSGAQAPAPWLGNAPQPQLACCVLLVNLKAKVISGTSFSLVVFPVIKNKKRLHLHLRNVASVASSMYPNRRERLLQGGWTSITKGFLFPSTAHAHRPAFTSVLSGCCHTLSGPSSVCANSETVAIGQIPGSLSLSGCCQGRSFKR